MAITDAQYQAWLQQDSVTRVLLVEATYYHAGAEHTVYLSNGIFVSTPADTPANMPYDDVILSIPQFQSSLSDGLEGFTVPSWGDIEISNELFDKDDWLDYAWDGRSVVLLFGDQAWPRSDFRPVLSGTIAGISVPSSSRLRLAIRDKQWQLNVPIQSKLIGEPTLTSGTTYKVSDTAVTSINSVWDNGVLLAPTTQYTTNASAGTFTLVNAATGRVTAQFTDNSGSTAASGAVVPLCFGQCFNISPICINSSLLKYQVHDGQIEAITDVRDNGVSVPFTANLTEGTFTLSGSPAGQVTVDAKGAKPSGVYLTTAGSIINHIVLTRTGLTAADISSASLAAFISKCPQTLGVYVSDRQNVINVLDGIVNSVGGWYTFNRAGLMIFGRLDAASGTPAAYINADDVIFGGLSITDISLPVATYRLGYRKNYTQQTQVAGSVAGTLYNLANQVAVRNNDAIKTVNLLATEPDTKLTNIVSQTDAEAEAERLLTLFGTTRKTYQAECITAPLTLNLGDIINFEHHRYGLDSGVDLVLTGIAESVTTRRVTLTLWG